jgi:hypothetical protein
VTEPDSAPPVGAVYCALVHHPVRDRGGETITSAITNIDVHDIARSARTYGLSGYFVVSPIAAQRLVVDRILEHWKTGAGSRRTPERSEALGRVHPVRSVEEAEAEIERVHGVRPTLLATEARPELAARVVSFDAERGRLSAASTPTMILFGTAHGIHPSLLDRVERVLEPIWGPTDYNHLSVRAAAAITFDRLFAPGR